MMTVATAASGFAGPDRDSCAATSYTNPANPVVINSGMPVVIDSGMLESIPQTRTTARRVFTRLLLPNRESPS
jgi:predicted kinase